MEKETLYKELVNLYKDYIDVLGEEIHSMAGLCISHGWRSSNIEKGEEIRNKIEAIEKQL